MIKVGNLSFQYGKTPFMEGLSFTVKSGEILGFLGPSGAGKSTLQKILIGLLTDYQGSVVVNGQEVKHHTKDYYEGIGIDFEFPSLYEKMTARENLIFFQSLYQDRTASIDELLDRVGLLKDADKRVESFSKGMKSRLNFIKALIQKPKLLFLDEPMSGLDPNNAAILKDIILEEKKKGTTIIITTHNMQDAMELCDRVAFIIDGAIKVIDSPHNLVMKDGAKSIVYTYIEEGKEVEGACYIHQTSADLKLAKLMEKNRIVSIHSQEKNLGDVFMELTGRSLV